MTDFVFDLPDRHRSIIKVIGVGGGGGNAVNFMFKQGIKDVDFVVCNTDQQALDTSPIPKKIQLGAKLTEGLGAGANPEVGQAAAEESEAQLKELFSDGTKMVFVTAGMGGGTGTGAAPVIARIAQEMGILTVAIVTAPFAFEGKKKKEQAHKGIDALKKNCDTVLVILNDKLTDIFGDLAVFQAFAQADTVLTNAARSIAEIITMPGYMNVDFEDVKKVMKNAGQAVMGSASAKGENRARKVIEEALNSPLLNNRDICGARKVLLAMYNSDSHPMTMSEQKVITDFIEEKIGIEADEIIMGYLNDNNLGEGLRVTVIATGFENEGENDAERKRYIDLDSNHEIRNKAAEDLKKTVEEINVTATPQTTQEPYQMIDMGEDAPVIDEEQLRKDKLLERSKVILKQTQLSQEELRDKENIPAYLRKGVSLKDIPHSSENQISRFSLDEKDGSLSGKNKYLHDNVD
ncbi:MAG: cell division protein FtsZ [Verrucomicrobia bacterium]|nr:cell division protein FtsZ [Cytophagales bacterium]